MASLDMALEEFLGIFNSSDMIRLKWDIFWLVVSNIFFIFHKIWDVILPTDELIFFKMVIAPPTSFYVLDLFTKGWTA